MTKTIIFDGREFANKKEEALALKALALRQKKVIPHLVSILVGDDATSSLYVNLKKNAVERIGGEATIVKLDENSKLEKILEVINWYNNDAEIQGIMVQMPLPGKVSEFRDEIINAIKPEKDVDGLRSDSKFVHPTTKAVIDIIDFANGYLDLSSTLSCTVVGATGMVGKSVVKELSRKGYKVTEVNSRTSNLIEGVGSADVLVSATGKPGLITEDMIKDRAIIIDVGSPKGDCDLDINSKASFITPVPGGVGPVTISCLLENLVEAAEKIK